MILECNQLTKRFGGFTALNEVNLSLESNQIIGLLGPNGSGKSTLIKLINGILVPDSGTIRINQMTPGVETKKIISYLPERNSLPVWMKIQDLIKMYAEFFEDFDPEKAKEMLQRLKIDAAKRVKTLSKGNREKVQLVLAMSRKSKLYCLDEPIGGVDPASRDFILNTILGNYREDSTILISTHLIQDVENILDTVVFIKEGNVHTCAQAEALREEYHESIDSIFREVFKC